MNDADKIVVPPPEEIKIAVDEAEGSALTVRYVVDMNKLRGVNGAHSICRPRDFISRSYTLGSTKRFVQWFNSDLEQLSGVPEVALCDEVFLHDEPDYADALHKLDLLEVGESCVVTEGECIVTRVK